MVFILYKLYIIYPYTNPTPNIFKICYHNTFSFLQINFIIIYLVEITHYFEFLMMKLISFIVLTHFFQFNQLKKFKATQVTHFFKLNQQYFFIV